MSGVGNIVTALPALREIDAVLVNPNSKRLTGAVFAALAVPGAIRRDELSLKPEHAFVDAQDLAGFVGSCRNDLEAPAIRMCHEIYDVQEALRALDGCLLGRMTGSGATCFGLFADKELAERCAASISQKAPGWWVKPCRLN